MSAPLADYPDPLRAALYRELSRLNSDFERNRMSQAERCYTSGRMAGLREALQLVNEHWSELGSLRAVTA